MRGRPSGRKRQLLVDSQGRLWAATVHSAHIADGRGALPLLSTIIGFSEIPQKYVAIKRHRPSEYNGMFAKALELCGITFQKASRPESVSGFIPIANRWVVETAPADRNNHMD